MVRYKFFLIVLISPISIYAVTIKTSDQKLVVISPQEINYFGTLQELSGDTEIEGQEPFEAGVSSTSMNYFLMMIKLINPQITAAYQIYEAPGYAFNYRNIQKLLVDADKLNLQGLPLEVLILECCIGLYNHLFTISGLFKSRWSAVRANYLSNNREDLVIGYDLFEKIYKTYFFMYNEFINVENYIKNPPTFSIRELLDHDRIQCDERLNLAGMRISRLQLSEIPNIHQVQHIDLSDNQLVKVCQNDFKDCISLRTLNLSRNGIKKIEAQSFAHLKELLVLNLSRNRLYLLANGLLSGLSKLTMLDLTHNILGSFNANEIKDVPTLRNLDVAGNKSLNRQKYTITQEIKKINQKTNVAF